VSHDFFYKRFIGAKNFLQLQANVERVPINIVLLLQVINNEWSFLRILNMSSQTFLLGDKLSTERLSWLAGCLKYSYLNQYSDALRHSGQEKSPIFLFFITGDALYSLHDRDLLNAWDMILSLPRVWIVCDREELDIRGLSVESLKIKYPDQIFDQNGRKNSYPRSFWRELVRVARRNNPDSSNFGYLQLTSPYMNRSCQNALTCLHAAIEEQMSPELYAYLDGIHVSHINQNPVEHMNIGQGFVELEQICKKKDLRFLMLSCGGCATTRGYATLDGGEGKLISSCAIRPCKMRSLNAIINRMGNGHIILGNSAASISMKSHESSTNRLKRKKADPPSIVFLMSHTPYETEYTLGGLSLAVGCAHHNIHTRVVFIEDGVYSLLGTHYNQSEELLFSIQEIIGPLAMDPNLEIYAYKPSIMKRSMVKNKKFDNIFEIETNELGQILFSPPRHIAADHQRILFM
jgi:tRNA 2-thiouridine synthesizing protein C